MVALSKPLLDFFQSQKARYGELFWYELREQSGRLRIILMLERLAEAARRLLAEQRITGIEVISFERDDSVGKFYLVETEGVEIKTRPSQQEYKDIADQLIDSTFIEFKNELQQNQLVRVYQPPGKESYCLVAYHSFGLLAPRGPIGWLENLTGLSAQSIPEFLKPKEFISFELALKKLEGLPYQLGGASFKNGFDCSSLVQWVYYQTRGVWLPRKASWQRLISLPVVQSQLRQADLIFFNQREDERKLIDHVGIIYQSQPERLPIIFHAKRLNRVLFEDLNLAPWLWRPENPQGNWEIHSFGRPKLPDNSWG